MAHIKPGSRLDRFIKGEPISFDDRFLDEEKLVMAEISSWVLNNSLMSDSIGEYLDLSDDVLDKLRRRINAYLDKGDKK